MPITQQDLADYSNAVIEQVNDYDERRLAFGWERKAKAVAESWQSIHRPRPASEWHEDFGCVLWWKLPIEEPPYCGRPDDSDWPEDGDEYYTHWTPLPEPINC